MERLSEKLAAPLRLAWSVAVVKFAVRGVVRSRVEGKKIGHPPVTFIRRDLAETNIMIKPLTLLAPWGSTGKVRCGMTGAPPPGAARIPPALRHNYPAVTTPTLVTAMTPRIGVTADASPAPVGRRLIERDRSDLTR